MKFIAHRSDDNREQTVKEHLLNVAELSESFAVPTFKPIARHIGKYSQEFQRRINGENNSAVEHAICGAKELQPLVRTDLFARLEQYCIVGHHSGLPDGGSDTDLADAALLCGRLKRVAPDYSAYAAEVNTAKPECGSASALFSHVKSKADVKEATELYAFITKYLFSCLTDADFIDAERFCNAAERGLYGDFVKAPELVDGKLRGFVNDTEVRCARARLQAQAISTIQKSIDSVPLDEMNALIKDISKTEEDKYKSMQTYLERMDKLGIRYISAGN